MGKKLRIGFFTESYYPLLNGVTTSVHAFSESLRKQGHTVYIIAPSVDDYVSDDKYLISLPSLRSFPSFPQFRLPSFVPDESYRKISELDLDIIHAHGYGAFCLLGFQAARRKKIPFVMTFHTMLTAYAHYFFNGRVLTPGVMRMILRFFASLCDGILAPSLKMKESLIDCGVTKEITLLPNFVPHSREQSKISTPDLRSMFDIAKNDTILLSVGRMEKEKNFMFLLKTLKKIHAEDTSVHLVLVGSGTKEQELRSFVSSNGLEKVVHFTGSIESTMLPGLYRSADIFVFSSTSEVHPMVVLEAASIGMPCIVAKDKAYSGIVVDGQNGYVLPLVVKQFEKAILSLVRDRAKQQAFAKASKDIATKQFSEDRIVDELVSYYLSQIKTYVPKKQMQKDFESDTFFEKIRSSLKNLDRLLSGK